MILIKIYTYNIETTVSLQTMQTQGQKIKELAKKKGLQMKWIAEQTGWSEAGLSRKVNGESSFDLTDLKAIAAFLGVTPEYLRDTTRPFNPGDEIPPDALAEKQTPITSTTPTDFAELARMMERQAADIARSESERMKLDIEVLKESNAQLAQILREVTGNLLSVSEIVKELKEDRDGEGDSD